jgi:hypothetical protein
MYHGNEKGCPYEANCIAIHKNYSRYSFLTDNTQCGATATKMKIGKELLQNNTVITPILILFYDLSTCEVWREGVGNLRNSHYSPIIEIPA